MSLRNIPFLIFFLFAINGVAFSQNMALSKIDKEDLKRHLTFISSDSLQGRKFGTDVDGLGITAEYLKTNAEKIGLKPGADNYFQKLRLFHLNPVKIVLLKLKEPAENQFLSQLP